MAAGAKIPFAGPSKVLGIWACLPRGRGVTCGACAVLRSFPTCEGGIHNLGYCQAHFSLITRYFY